MKIAQESELLSTVNTAMPKATRVLLFAPHPDDEVFGCGGMLALLHKQGSAISVIIVTDGAAGGQNHNDSLSVIRAAESRNAAGILGLDEPLFWGEADRGLVYGEKLIERIKDAICEAQPDLVLLPSLTELHPDHQSLALAGSEALRRLGGERTVAYYEINNPLADPNLLLDISLVIELKRAAMACFPSQLQEQPYDLRIEGLNRHRAYFLGPRVVAAEAYLVVAVKDLAAGLSAACEGPLLHRRQRGFVADFTDLPLVSIIVRSMNRQGLSRALDSLALQTYPNLEVVAVNAKGGQHADLPTYCGRFPLRLLNQDGEPLPRARAANAGLAACQGKYIGFLDDDDTLDPDHLHWLVETLQHTVTPCVAYSGIRGSNGNEPNAPPVEFRESGVTFARLLLGNVLPIHAPLFPAELLKEGIRFDEAFDLYEDWDFWMQLARRVPFVFTGRVSGTYFLGGQSGASCADGTTPDADKTAHAHEQLFAKWAVKMGPDELKFIREFHARAVAEKDNRVATLENMIKESEVRAATLEGMVRGLDTQLETLKLSRSWRITAPLRKFTDLIRDMRQQSNHLVRSYWRRIPLSDRRKQQLKHFIFSYFGFACRWLTAYRLWKNYQDVQLTLPLSFPVPKPKVYGDDLIQGTQAVAADGVWEWSDYQSVKECIRHIKTDRLQTVNPEPVEIIDKKYNDLTMAIKDIRLPLVEQQPDVSIIIPVYNNLKFTVECLLSISIHAEPSVSFEIIVADDASTDGTAELLGTIDNLRLMRNPVNLGFLRNSNRALDMVKGRYTVFLNNDVQVTSGWLVSLLETFTAYPRVGAVGPRFLYPDGRLQEMGVAFRYDGAVDMVGLNDDPSRNQYSYIRRVDYISGACLMLPTALIQELRGFSEEFLPCYCEDGDLCLRVQERGYFVYCNPHATIIHHLSKTMDGADNSFKLGCITANLTKLVRRWAPRLENGIPRLLAFYLPQYHPIPENNAWWGQGFTEWTNVAKARPNFMGHYQPRLPADLGYYDLRIPEIMEQQVELARRYGIHGFCYYYYWFNGARLLELPLERMLSSGRPDFPFCLCWANENWTRRWDGQEQEILMQQSHTEDDDREVIADLARFFRDNRYIRIDGRPLIAVYRVSLFPDFKATARRWRSWCRDNGIGEIYIVMVESFELVHSGSHPGEYGCDASIEFPPQGMAAQKPPSGNVINPEFVGMTSDYRELAVQYATRELPHYTRFMGVTPGWDNTARRQNTSFCLEHATPGAFQAWLEEAIEQTRRHQYGDERLIFINAWNEWAEGAYLEPDQCFGHSYLEAVRNALDASRLHREPGQGGAGI